MTKKQKVFCKEYLIDLNSTQAAIRAGYSAKTAYSTGQRMLKNVETQKYIQELMEKREARTEVTQDMIIQELAAIAFSRVTDYVNIKSKGNIAMVTVKETEGLSDMQVKALAGIKEGANGIEVKLNDKQKALELLGRHLGMWNDKVDVSVNTRDETVKKLGEIFKCIPQNSGGT